MLVDLSKPPTRQLLGSIVGVSAQAVSAWYTDGRLPPDATLGQALRLMFSRLREKAAGRYSEGPLDLAQERAALAREQRVGLEIKNAVLRGEYASIALLSQVLATASQAVVERLDHLPNHLRKTCPDMTDDEREQVMAVIAQARNEWVRATAELVARRLAAEDDELAEDGGGGRE